MIFFRNSFFRFLFATILFFVVACSTPNGNNKKTVADDDSASDDDFFDDDSQNISCAPGACDDLAFINTGVEEVILAGPIGYYNSNIRSNQPGEEWAELGAGDLDGDGLFDLVFTVLSDSPSPFYVALNEGGGNFKWQKQATLTCQSVEYSNRGVALADINHDGCIDVAFAGNQCLAYSFGDCSGQFGDVTLVKTDLAATTVAFGDFNHDGYLDMVIGGTGGIEVFLNDGQDGLQLGNTYDVSASWLATADFNEDGKMDIVAASTAETSILLGHGDGTFSVSPKKYPGAFSVSVADLNNDGHLDYLLSGAGGKRAIAVYLGKGNGSFVPGFSYDDLCVQITFMATVGEFDGDGNVDIIAACHDLFKSKTSSYDSALLTILSGNGDGSFHNPFSLDTYQADSIIASKFH